MDDFILEWNTRNDENKVLDIKKTIFTFWFIENYKNGSIMARNI